MPGLPLSRAAKIIDIVNSLEVPVEHRGYIMTEFDGLPDKTIDIIHACVERAQGYVQASFALMGGMRDSLDRLQHDLKKR